jgi:hypothetical protein
MTMAILLREHWQTRHQPLFADYRTQLLRPEQPTLGGGMGFESTSGISSLSSRTDQHGKNLLKFSHGAAYGACLGALLFGAAIHVAAWNFCL